MKNTLKLTISSLGLLACPLMANIRINFDTDGSGTPIVGTGAGVAFGSGVGSFTGTGTLDNNIATGTGGDDIVDIGNGAKLGTDVVADATGDHNFNPEVLRMETTFGLKGGTADLRFSRAGSFYKGWSIDELAGVTELKLTSEISLPLHARSNNTSETFLQGLPWGISTGLANAGTGLTESNFNVTYSITDLYYLSDPDNPATSTQGTPAAATAFSTATAFASAGWDNISLSDTQLLFESTDGFDGLSSGASLNNLLVRGLNEDGLGSIETDDFRSFYATKFEVTITPTGTDSNGDNITAFASDTQFNFSYDGDRSTVLPASVPEPSSSLLIGLAGLGLITRRRKQ